MRRFAGLMLALLVFAALPLSAQVSFEARRLDDSLSNIFFYPDLLWDSAGFFHTGWTETGDNLVSVFGRHVYPDGSFGGPATVIEQGDFDEFTCPPKLEVIPLSGGGQARSMYHA